MEDKFDRFEKMDELLTGMMEADYDACSQLASFFVTYDLGFLSGKSGARQIARNWGHDEMLQFLLEWYVKEKEGYDDVLLKDVVKRIEDAGDDPAKVLEEYINSYDPSVIRQEDARQFLAEMGVDELCKTIIFSYMKVRKIL